MASEMDFNLPAAATVPAKPASLSMGTWAGLSSNVGAMGLICYLFFQGVQDLRTIVKEDLKAIRDELHSQQMLGHELKASVDGLSRELRQTRSMLKHAIPGEDK